MMAGVSRRERYLPDLKPLPPGTPYDEQQFAAFMLETAGTLDIPEGEKAALAARIGRRMGG